MPRDNLLVMDHQVKGETAQLNLVGELIAETRMEPERILREWFEGGVTRVIIRCAALSYIDSAGLSTLLGALHRFRRQGGDLVLADMNPALSAIFEVTSMEKYFKIFPSIPAALAHFEQLAAQTKKKRPSRPANARNSRR
jgi:anti-sigma B factor antagonist